MSELPKGWVTCTPSDLANDPKNEIVDGPFGSNLKASEYTDEGTPIVRIQNVKRMAFLNKNIKYVTDEKAEFLKRHSFKSGDLLITKLGEPLGLTCIAPEHLTEGIIVADIVRLRPNPEVNRKCLAYLLNSEGVIKQINAHTKGSTRARINLSVVRNLNINLPPLAEQKRIVEKLDEVLAQVDTIKTRLDGIPDLLKRFRQSVLASAVSGKLTESSSSTWLEGELSDVATFQNGYAFKSGWFSDEGDFQVIKLGNVKDDYLKLDTAPAYLNSKQAQEYLKFKPSVGDVLLSMTGTKFKRDYGFACLVERDLPVLINQRVGRILPERKKVIPEFLHLYLRSELFRNQFFAGETGGVNQGNVGSKHIMSCKLSIPSLENQHLIASKARNLFVFADTIEAQVKKAQVRVDKLTQSILAKAFRGELVEQDPNDEPADKLLERIAEARKEAEALAKAAKKAEAAKKRAAKSA